MNYIVVVRVKRIQIWVIYDGSGAEDVETRGGGCGNAMINGETIGTYMRMNNRSFG
jgi:hypothetical protein